MGSVVVGLPGGQVVRFNMMVNLEKNDGQNVIKKKHIQGTLWEKPVKKTGDLFPKMFTPFLILDPQKGIFEGGYRGHKKQAISENPTLGAYPRHS